MMLFGAPERRTRSEGDHPTLVETAIGKSPQIQ